MRDLHAIWDGDQGPVFRFRLRDGSGYRDLSSAAVECYIADSSGTSIGMRPGVVISPKTDGHVDVLMRGKETDWDGLGKDLYLVPRVYYATAADGTAATNLLLNPSFDTGAGTVADNWTQLGTLGSTVFALVSDDPAPPVIFGKAQRCYVPSAGSSAYLNQQVTSTIAAGDYISTGVWVRAKLDSGAALQGEPGYKIEVSNSGIEKTTTYIAAGTCDWTFYRAELKCASAGSSVSAALVSYDAIGYDVRWDDAFLFKGRWAVFHPETYRIPVRPRPRPSKAIGASNFIKARGGFEQDSNTDGVADGWSKTGSTNTYALETDPDNIDATGIETLSRASQKVTLSGSATDQLRLIYRGHFKAGETWRFQVVYKNSGALSGSPANGDFGLVVHTEEFDGTYETSSLTGANFSLSSIAAFLGKFRTVALTADHSVLVCDINLKTASGGTLWLDHASLLRSA